MHHYRYSFAMALVMTCGVASTSHAEVRVEGDLTAVRVTTNQDSIADVLSAFNAALNVRYRTAVRLDAPAKATYTGSFGQVVSNLLDGYNYVVKKDRETTEIMIVGRRGEFPVAPANSAAQPKGILSRWR